MCGGELRIIAFITEGPAIWDSPGGETGDIDPQAQPAPDFAFDQRIAW